MPTSSALRSGIKNYARYLNVLSGTEPYVAPILSDYDLLESNVLSAAETSVTFSNLNSTYGADYQHLQLRISAKTSSGNGSSGNNLMTFNSDGGANYSWHRLRGASDESTPGSQAGTNQSAIDWGFIPRDNSGNGSYAGYVLDILYPFETTRYTTTRCFWGFWQASVEYVGLNSGLWMNTNALTDISFSVTSYSYAANSRFSLYGLKKAGA